MDKRQRRKEYQSKYYQANKEKLKARASAYAKAHRQRINARAREYYHKRYAATKAAKIYGISKADAVDLLSRRECAICRGPADSIDHNHATGRVRDRLCHLCNRGLGYFKDSSALLRDAAEYLEKHS